jgi:hypothetical protein
MAKQESESKLTRRLRELEEEGRALQHHLKDVERKARRMENLVSEPGLTRTEPRLASTVPRPGAAPQPTPDDDAEEAVPTAAPASRPSAIPGMAPRNPNANPERFANYLASGSFGNSRPLGRERRVMRNKAIFMLILVALVAFLLYRVVFSA